MRYNRGLSRRMKTSNGTGMMLLYAGLICAGSDITLAVYDLEGQAVAESDARILSDRLRAELVSTGLMVLERSRMEDILQEQGFQQSDVCSDQSCMVKIGELLGVTRMVAGTVGKTGGTLTLSIRVVDVNNGRILTTVTNDCRCTMEEMLKSITRETARKLAAELTGQAYQPETKVKSKTGRLIRRIGFGVAAIGFGVGGYWVNMQIDDLMKDNRDIAGAYALQPTNQTYAADSAAYKKNWDKAKKLSTVRSVVYGAAAACGVGFIVSIPF
jgi:TolB-like protein